MNLLIINLVKIWIITIGVLFSAPLYAFFFYITKGRKKYLYTSLGSSVGEELIGRNILVVSLYIYYSTQSTSFIGLYLATICLLSLFT
jgi:hypothetical protein